MQNLHFYVISSFLYFTLFKICLVSLPPRLTRYWSPNRHSMLEEKKSCVKNVQSDIGFNLFVNLSFRTSILEKQNLVEIWSYFWKFIGYQIRTFVIKTRHYWSWYPAKKLFLFTTNDNFFSLVGLIFDIQYIFV